MAKPIGSKTIGAFVVGSVALAAVVALFMGLRQLSRRPQLYICMFQGGLNGLKVGAAVKVRGVQIGSVKRISLRLHPGEGELRDVSIARSPMPVLLEIDEQEAEGIGVKARAFDRKRLDDLIKQGLRAQLNTENLLTGMLYIDLNFNPDTPLNLYIEPGSGPYPEIPSIPTQMEQLRESAAKGLAKLQSVDFPEIVIKITDAGLSIKQLAGDPKIQETITSVEKFVSDPHLKAAVDQLDVSLGQVNGAVLSMRSSIDRKMVKLDPRIANFQRSAVDLQSALEQARASLASAQLKVSPNSPVAHKLDETLEKLKNQSRSIHDLADYLQRNPSALIHGKYVSGGNQ